MKTSELLRLFRKYGVYEIKGNKKHAVWYSPITGKKIRVWRHAREIPSGTWESMLKDAGIKEGLR